MHSPRWLDAILNATSIKRSYLTSVLQHYQSYILNREGRAVWNKWVGTMELWISQDSVDYTQLVSRDTYRKQVQKKTMRLGSKVSLIRRWNRWLHIDPNSVTKPYQDDGTDYDSLWLKNEWQIQAGRSLDAWEESCTGICYDRDLWLDLAVRLMCWVTSLLLVILATLSDCELHS